MPVIPPPDVLPIHGASSGISSGATDCPSIAVQMAQARASGRAQAILRPGSGAAPSLVARAKEVLRVQGFQTPMDSTASPATAPSR